MTAVPPPAEGPSHRRRTIELIVLIALVVAFVAVSVIVHWPRGEAAPPDEAGAKAPAAKKADAEPEDDPKERGKTLGIILAAGLTLIMYSFLYRDNPFFKAAENLYVGVVLGYGAIQTWWLRPEVFDPLFRPATPWAFYDGLPLRAVAIFFGLLLLTRLSRKHGWISRYTYALLVGFGAGVAIPNVINSFILKQLQAAVKPFQEATVGVPLALSWEWFSGVAWPILTSLVVLIGTVTVLFYFFFSIEHKGPAGAVSRTGIWFLMISFGASFAFTVMGRVSLLIGRGEFLLFEWLKLFG